MERIEPGLVRDLFNTDQTREIEQALARRLPAHTLMQRASEAVGRLALAVAPHAKAVWLGCGPGNNGGDGLQAAAWLQASGKACHVTWLGSTEAMSADTAMAWRQAKDAGVQWCESLQDVAGDVDLCVDALLGLGSNSRPIEGRLAELLRQIQQHKTPVLAVDLPTGLDADTGNLNNLAVRADHTLSLLTLKPGLFTGHGRDHVGQVWLDALQRPADLTLAGGEPAAQLLAAAQAPTRAHASHKGSYGDVAVLGGAPGMAGAAVLAASAALHAGAGRVFVSLLDPSAANYDAAQPELMFRTLQDIELSSMTLVCGCGAGADAATLVDAALPGTRSLVLDADALNAIAADDSLKARLLGRAKSATGTVLTPHPLEAARLLGCSTNDVQNNRLAAAKQLSEAFQCCVVLKGSGTVISAPGQISRINPTGSARLAIAGTGDVLAGLIGARIAQGHNPWDAACAAVYQHGELADHWPASDTLTAGRLARALRF